MSSTIRFPKADLRWRGGDILPSSLFPVAKHATAATGGLLVAYEPGAAGSARYQRYLGDMGVNLQMWVHAMETPNEKLLVFKSDELKSLNIVMSAACCVAAWKFSQLQRLLPI